MGGLPHKAEFKPPGSASTRPAQSILEKVPESPTADVWLTLTSPLSPEPPKNLPKGINKVPLHPQDAEKHFRSHILKFLIIFTTEAVLFFSFFFPRLWFGIPQEQKQKRIPQLAWV